MQINLSTTRKCSGNLSQGFGENVGQDAQVVLGPGAYHIPLSSSDGVQYLFFDRSAARMLFEAIDDRLRNACLQCRQARDNVGIRNVEEKEIDEVDRGGYRWCVEFIRGRVTRGSSQVLRGERSRTQQNRDGKHCE